MEEYINTIIGENFYHPMNKSGKGKEYLFSKKRGRIYPDFISRNNDNRIIADAKYKTEKNIGRGNDDYFQILAYMYRFESKKSFLIHPIKQEEDSPKIKIENFFLNSGLSHEKNVESRNDIHVSKIGLFVPSNCDSYKDIVSEFEENTYELIKNIK